MKVTVVGTRTLTVEYESPKPFAEILRENGFGLSLPCGGHHRCGKCRIRAEGALSPETEEEKRLLAGAPEGVRLACMACPAGDCRITLSEASAEVVSDGFVSRFEPGPQGSGFGFAADIGTTTVAVYGYDLRTGCAVCRDAFLNPQKSFGGDVISRIGASVQGSSAEMASLIGGAISDSFHRLCRESGTASDSVDAAVITGNTTMLYLLLGKDVKCLSAAPFAIEDYLGRWFPAAEAGISGFPKLRVFLPRTMGAFVGSDITCAALASRDLMRTPRASLLIDIGTNGEMALRKDGRLICCSTAAGPAFEGAGITMGSMAVPGAVNKVRTENGELRWQTIGGVPANGVCGSGLIDAVAAFLSLGLIDETGRIGCDGPKPSPLLTEFDGKPALKIGSSGVMLTQSDVREVQLAKAAVCAGIFTLLHACGIGPEQVDALILAGGFGSYIGPESAGKIGLIPPELAGKARAVGNAAGMGASAMLLSRKASQEGTALAESAQLLDLTTSAFFMDQYVECMSF